MAGRGPAPKPADKRARRNKDPQARTVLRFELGKQPVLPRRMPSGDPWPPRTRTWWKKWGNSPQAELLTDVDWEYLLDTATLHGRLWQGDASVAGELRLRVAKFGATMEDRARLRMEFALADEADAARPEGGSNRERYGDLKVVPGGGGSRVAGA